MLVTAWHHRNHRRHDWHVPCSLWCSGKLLLDDPNFTAHLTRIKIALDEEEQRPQGVQDDDRKNQICSWRLTFWKKGHRE